MEPSKKNPSIERGNGENHRKIKTSSSSQVATTKRSQNITTSSNQNKTSTSRASCTNISTHTQFEFGAADISNTYQTSEGFTLPTRAGRTEVDLLGLAPQTPQGYQAGEAHQAPFVDSIGDAQSNECLYHHPILLMSANLCEHGRNLDPMARWLAEGHAEQCAVVHLSDGQLSMHKDCQCSNVLPSGMEMEIEE